MQFIKKLMQKLCTTHGIDYHLAKKSLHVLAIDAKQFFKTIDEFLYTKVYKPHTIKTVLEGAYSYVTCDRQEIRHQWMRVKEDWGLFRNILGNRYAKEGEYTKEQTKEQHTRKRGHTTIDDYVNTTHDANIIVEDMPDVSYIKKPEYRTNTKNRSETAGAPPYEFSPAYASQVIIAVQQYRGKSLEKVQSYLGSKMQLHENLESTLAKAMQYRVQETTMQDTFPTIRFAKELLSTDMRAYITKNYINSSSSIHQLSESFEKTYGMHISTATFSKYARALITNTIPHTAPIHSRREARIYTSQLHASQLHYCRQEQISPTIAAA